MIFIVQQHKKESIHYDKRGTTGDSIQEFDWHRLPIPIVLLDRLDFLDSFLHHTLVRSGT